MKQGSKNKLVRHPAIGVWARNSPTKGMIAGVASLSPLHYK
jgi:hypothetical protein